MAVRAIAHHMKQAISHPARQVVALFNASDDTVEMVQRMLDASGFNCLVGCHFTDLKKGTVDFARYLGEHQPQVVIFDISPPYKQNWDFFTTLRDAGTSDPAYDTVAVRNAIARHLFSGPRLFVAGVPISVKDHLWVHGPPAPMAHVRSPASPPPRTVRAPPPKRPFGSVTSTVEPSSSGCRGQP